MGHSSLIRSTMTSTIELIWKAFSTYIFFIADQPIYFAFLTMHNYVLSCILSFAHSNCLATQKRREEKRREEKRREEKRREEMSAQANRVMALSEWEDRWQEGKTGFHRSEVHK